MKKLQALLIILWIFNPLTSYGALTDNLVSYWQLDETSGARVDAHSSNDLTDNNTVLYGTGIISNAGDFETGNTESLSITDGSQTGLDLSGDFSFSLWFKPESSIEAPLIAKGYSSGNYGYRLFTSNDGGAGLHLMLSSNGSSATFRSWSWSDTPGTWYHIVVTYTASTHTAEAFIDGSSLGTVDMVVTSIHNSNQSFYIASDDSAPATQDGLIDETGIWTKVLSGAEITELYNAGAGLAYPFSETSTSTASTTSGTTFIENLGDVTFGLAIIITLMSLGLIGFVYNTFNKRKKPWQ